MATIELLCILSNLPWEAKVFKAMKMADINTDVILHPFPPSRGSRLEIRYGVLGLYKMGMAIAQGNQFYKLHASLYVKNLEVGWFDLRPRPAKESNGGYSSPLLSVSTNTTPITIPDSGKMIDPNDPKFVVAFTWDHVRIKPQDVYTLFLDAFAIAAPHNNNDPGAGISAARSASGDTVLSTWTVGENGNAQMTWSRLKRALIVVWDFLIIGDVGRKPKFEGISFDVAYDGLKIGEGRILRLDDRGDEGDGGSAAEKSED